MIDDLLRPIGPGPRPPADGFVQALRAGRRKRWRTLRNNAVCAAAALATVLTAMVPRLSLTSFAGLEPTHPVIGNDAPRPAMALSPAPSPTTSPRPEPRDPETVDDRPGFAPAGPAGQTSTGYAPAASRGPAGPRAGGVAESPPPPDAHPDSGDEPVPAPAPPPAPPEPTAEPTHNPPPEPEPVDLSYEDESISQACQGTEWCWSVQVVDSYTLRLRACRPGTAATLGFTKEYEADFRILRDGAEVWRWSVGQPDPDFTHTVPVEQWQCAVWSTLWHAVDQSGDAVPEGTYRLEAMCRSTSIPARWLGTSFSVT